MTLYHRLINPTTHRPDPAIIMQLAHHRAARDAQLNRRDGYPVNYRASLAQYLKLTWDHARNQRAANWSLRAAA